MSDEIVRLAQALARNCGYAVFPCSANKKPTRPSEDDVLHGFHDATTDPDRIAELWRRWPGPLIGIATGERSGVSVLDVDRKHPQAVGWWQDHHHRLLPTRAFATRSGGLHLYFRHREGVRNTQGRIAKGVDTRGDGGFCICWFAAGRPGGRGGLPCLDHSAAAVWPDWLYAALQPPKPAGHPPYRGPVDAGRAIDGIVRSLAEAKEGERNAVLYWCARRCVERGMRQGEIEALLIPTAIGIGLSDTEARRTVTSAQRRAVA